MLTRDDALAAVTAERFDVVVIGGGITGAGVALDAASRGYTVALVERDDYAIGTSSRSSKMVHGGLRYLQNFDLGLVREALLERQLMVQLAPHLVYPTPFLVPTLGDDRRNRLLGIGLNMYDVMATTRVGMSRRERAERLESADYWAPDRHRTIPGEEVAELIPALADRDPRQGYLFYDCQTDDVRLVLTILGEADRFGAVAVNGTEVTGLLERDGRAAGVRCRATGGDDEFEIEADNVVNATGVWADRIRPEEIHNEAEVPRIAPSRGTHVTVPLEKLRVTRAACVVPAGESRTIFALPWYGRALIGTTDNDYEGDLAHVQPGEDDITYLLHAVNTFFGTELDRGDLTGAYAGVRPLISTGDPRKSVDISRKAELYETSSGMLTITGGKLTTWRRMAKQVVDRLVEREGRIAMCRTDDIPLGLTAEDGDLEPPPSVDAAKLHEDYRPLLAFRYGHAARNVLRLAGERPELAEPIVEGQPDLLAEVVIGARREQARSVADVLLRRTRLGLLAAPQLRTPASVSRVAALLGEELGWDDARVAAEAERWVAEASAEGIDPAAAG
ncbi:MAG TPA: glycerol-3-phosphate dehydrogenase/oxidase [Solirubrobacterales bacterium]|nr:glycerol-3-phosphate dehydrogenase/oxidase [Solirubrobacterales bacterium]